jgi:hypothetical protein
MPVTISKNSGATTYSIRNFTSLRLNGITPIDIISDIAGDETDTMLLKFFGPQLTIDVSWVITDESSSVVSGTGGSVTTAVAQTKYLYDTLWSKGSTSDTDEYNLELDFGSGITMFRTGHVTNIDVSMTSHEPLTFSGTMRFEVGHNPLS